MAYTWFEAAKVNYYLGFFKDKAKVILEMRSTVWVLDVQKE
jgi:hypothetical protein